VSITDYVIDILLILFIFRQVRPHELTLRTLVLPLTLIVLAGIIYLRPVTLTSDDLALVVLLTSRRRGWHQRFPAVRRDRPSGRCCPPRSSRSTTPSRSRSHAGATCRAWAGTCTNAT
jgi:hypothetical protein